MSQLVFLVVTDPDKTHAVIKAWLKAGAAGIMMIETRGLAHVVRALGARDDMPLIPSLSRIIEPREQPYEALLDIVPDDFDIPGLVAATEKITGPLSESETGILFTLPISGVWGTQQRREKPLR